MFRMPYWDWARKRTPHFPKETLEENYIEEGPPLLEPVKASQEKNYNPLYGYPFPEDTPPEITVGVPKISTIWRQVGSQDFLL